MRYGEYKNGMLGQYELHYKGQTRYENNERKLRIDCEDAGASHLYYRGNHDNEDGSTSDTRSQTYTRRELIRYKLRMFKKANSPLITDNNKPEYAPSAYNPAYHENTDDDNDDDEGRKHALSTSKYQSIKIKEENVVKAYDVETDDSDEELGAMIYT